MTALKIGWITDPHMNFVAGLDWWHKVLDDKDDCYIITGDIAEASTVTSAIRALAEETSRPIFFVLGNHDFYGSKMKAEQPSIAETKAAVAKEASFPLLQYLDALSDATSYGRYVELTPKVHLVGVDGWYDTLNGDVERTRMSLADFSYIRDFSTPKNLPKKERNKRCRALAAEAASRLVLQIKSALGDKRVETLVVATHVPPFAGASWHQGALSDDDALPFFSNRLVGESLLAASEDFRQAGGKVVVLCGHTHSHGVCTPGENLYVVTGAAEYYDPKKAGTLHVGAGMVPRFSYPRED